VNKEATVKDTKDLLISKLSRFVTFLNSKRSEFLTKAQQVHEIKNVEYFRVRTKLLTDEGQFRLRYIKKNSSFPIDLFSLDYRTKIEIEYRAAIINMNIDIPFLDIAVIINRNIKTKYYKNEVVDIEKSRVVPVATLDFLLADLEKTYTTPNLAAARYWNDKNNKDINRYRILQNVKYQDNGDEMEIDSDEILDAVVEDTIWKNINSFQNTNQGQQYADAFRRIMKRSKRYKYKIKFTDLTEDTDVDNNEDEFQLTDMEID
jgi:hypothetical protein